MVQGIRNLLRYGSTVWKHHWWDFGYQMDMMDKMLEECEENWHVNTVHLGSGFILGRIKVVRRYYKRYLEAADLKEENRLRDKFLHGYARLLPRLWD